MAERIPPNNAINDSNAAASSTNARPRGGAPLPSVRRNLFQNSHSAQGGQNNTRPPRRPVQASSRSSEALRLEANFPGPESSEIVVRDRHGQIELGEPPSPDLEDLGEQPLDSRQEIEQEKQRLADAVRHYQASSTGVHDQPEELLEAVRTSLKTKVASLAEDNWMYEPEEQIRSV